RAHSWQTTLREATREEANDPASTPHRLKIKLVVADIDLDSADPDIDVALRYARPWRRLAQDGLYTDRLVAGDPRSDIHTAF
ncbi:hypothetical protein ACIF6G_36135, partial [Streptomyces sp. NPDC086010]